MAKRFWTDKWLESLSKTSLTLFQGFMLAGVLGGVFGKIDSSWLKTLFIVVTLGFLAAGILLADKTEERN